MRIVGQVHWHQLGKEKHWELQQSEAAAISYLERQVLLSQEANKSCYGGKRSSLGGYVAIGTQLLSNHSPTHGWGKYTH